MNILPELVKSIGLFFILPLCDLFLLFYLCGGSRETIRKRRNWWSWFAIILISLTAAHYIFLHNPTIPITYYLFFGIRYGFLLLFSIFCTDTHRNARYYLVMLVMLSSDFVMANFQWLSVSVFGVDYLFDTVPYLLRLVAHILLVPIKFGVVVLVKKWTRTQIYGIESPIQSIVIMLPAVPYFFVRNLPWLLRMTSQEVPWIIHFVALLCGATALLSMIISENLYYQIKVNDQLRMEQFIKKQQDQYKVTQNTIEAVNRKYHDLRHIMRGIDSMTSIEDIKKFIHTVEGEIQDYEMICNTGNKTLDLILSERLRECKKKGIQMYVHTNGQDWGMVRDADIATIFGNALENAIESTEQIEDPSLRRIDVRANRINNMLIARFENQYTHVLEKRQTQFVSTKRDKANHGYGLQSIEMTVKRYGGELDIKTDNGPFTLTVIIPVSPM